MEMKKMIPLFMDYCLSRQLRPKTMLSYEQANRLFALWLEESEGVKHVEEIKDMHIRRYIIELQSSGKYIAIRIPSSENVPASSAVRDVYIAAPHSHC